MNSYSVLAELYERLIIDCDYEKWSQYLLNKVQGLALGKKGLDLACGSGKITRAFAKAGYKMTGGDISEQMLTQAKNLSMQEGLAIDYYYADLNKLYARDKFDFVTVINDGINYISSKNLCKAFSGIAKQLNSGGILIFDISSEYKLKNLLANNLFGEDEEDFSYLWFNKLFDDRVEMDLSFFIKKGNLYQKSEEKHTQYIHSEESIISACLDCGFEKVEVNYSREENPLRITFIMRKK